MGRTHGLGTGGFMLCTDKNSEKRQRAAIAWHRPRQGQRNKFGTGLLRDNQNPMRCDNQTCQAHWAVCYVGVHRSLRLLAAKTRVKPDLRPPPSAATGLDADFGHDPLCNHRLHA